jgi:hypothetical protein
MSDDNINLDPNKPALTLTADVLQLVVLDAGGVPFSDSDPDSWQAADEAEPEYVHVGSVQLKIIAEAADLAVAVGAIERGEAVLCLRAAFEKGETALTPAAGQYVTLDAGGVQLVFLVAATHQDLHGTDGPDLGPNAMYDKSFDMLKADEVLLVQVLGAVGDQPSEVSL